MPLNRFIDCVVDDNLHALVISGHPSPAELLEAWQNISNEFAEAVGNHEYRLYINLYKEISLLRMTYDQIWSLVEFLQVMYNDYLHSELSKLLKTKLTLNPRDQVSYQEELQKCLRRSKGIKIKLDLKMLEFKAVEAKQKASEKYDRSYFITVMINISDHAKYQVPETITVAEYCLRLKRLNQYREQLNAKK